MKSVYLLLLIAVLTACTTPKPDTTTVIPTPPVTPSITPPKPIENPINPEKKEVFFGAKEDTIVVNTKGDFWDMELFMGDDVYLQPINKTCDTIESSWSKIIALPHTTYIGESGSHHYLAKQIKLIVFDNESDGERWCSAHLIFGDWNAWIDITQSAEEK